MSGSPFPLWRDAFPLILASKSPGRRLALSQAGVPFESVPADVDERAIEAGLGDVRAGRRRARPRA